MGGVCVCNSWTCRPMCLLLVILAAAPCVADSSESPAAAAAVGKMYPRGNHWAVGHLMGKKSIERLPELQETNQDRDFLSASVTAQLTQRLLDALLQQHKHSTAQPAARLLQLNSGWREEDRDKYLREMSDLFLLALKLRDDDST